MLTVKAFSDCGNTINFLGKLPVRTYRFGGTQEQIWRTDLRANVLDSFSGSYCKLAIRTEFKKDDLKLENEVTMPVESGKEFLKIYTSTRNVQVRYLIFRPLQAGAGLSSLSFQVGSNIIFHVRGSHPLTDLHLAVMTGGNVVYEQPDPDEQRQAQAGHLPHHGAA